MKQGLKFKRFFVSVLLLAVSTLSWAYQFEVDGIYYYTADGNNVAVKGNSGTGSYSGTVVIPSSVEYNDQNYTVTSIGGSAFRDCSGLTSITIPNSVTSIGNQAFYDCSGLTSVTIPESVTSIGSYAFYDCFGLTSITIPESVTSIGEGAFEGCSGLKSISIPNGVTSIDYRAFYNCSGLTSITIPDGVTNISGYAFYGCSGLMSVTIGNGVTSIGTAAFFGCSGLMSVTIGSGVTSIGLETFRGCSGLTSVTCMAETTPNFQTGPAAPAFENLPLSEMTLYVPAASVNAYKAAEQWKEFGTIKAYDLPVATSVALNKTETTIVAGAQEQLTATVLPEDATDKTVTWTSSNSNIATVDENGLVTAVAAGTATITATTNDGTSLEASCAVTVVVPAASVALNKTETTIVAGAQEQLTATVLPEDATDKKVTWTSSDPTVATVDENGLVTAVTAGTATITATTTDGTNLEASCAVTVIQLATSVALNKTETTLEVGAQEQLTATVLPEDATNKAVTWTSSDPAVATVDENGLVTAVAAGAATVTTTTTDGTDLKASCAVTVIKPQIISGKCGPNVSFVLTDDYTLTISGTGYMNSYHSYSPQPWKAYSAQIKNVVIENGVTSIGSEAFSGCSGLTSITTPESVTSIGESAFSGCSSLTAINIPESVTNIGRMIFSACPNLISISVDENNPVYDSRNDCNAIIESSTNKLITGCKSSTIPESVTRIGGYAFYNCIGLISFTIPESVTYIGNYAFDRCSDLESVVIGSGVTEIWWQAFSYCSKLMSVTCMAENVPETNGAYGHAFDGLPLNEMTLYVPSVSLDAYKAANVWKEFGMIKSVAILSGKCGNNVDFVLTDDYTLTISGTGDMFDFNANYNFKTPWDDYITQIRNVVIENGVTSVGSFAFSGCSGLTSINVPNSVTSIRYYAFDDCSGLTSVTIGSGITSVWSLAFVRCSSLSSITCMAETVPYAWGAYGDPFGHLLSDSTQHLPLYKMTLYVPSVSLNAYRTTDKIWKEFGTIKAYDLPDATSVALNKTETTIVMGAQEQLTATVLPEEALQAVTWASSDPAVATVDENGLVTAVAAGAATITATTNDGTSLEASCAVTVVVPVASIALNKTETTITVEAQEQLTVTVLPEDATDKTITWTSSDPAVATVDENGLVTAVAAGTATITATTNDGTSLEASCAVTVVVPAASIALNKTETTIVAGAQEQLTATVLPEDATDKTVTWTSSNSNIATVDENGLVTAVAAGAATITATTTDGTNLSATCAVTVAPPFSGDYYILNVETDLFLGGQNLWGTQATLSEDAGIFQFVPGATSEGYNIVNTLISVANKNLGTNLYTDNNGLATVKDDEAAGITKMVDGIWTIEPQGEGIFAFKCVSEWKWENDAWVEIPHGYLCKSETAGYRKGFELMFSETLTDACLFRVMTRDEALAYMVNKAQSSKVSFNFLLKNPDFCRNQSTAAWTVSADCTNKNLCGGFHDNCFAESFHSTFTISQIVKDLPAGRYQLSAQGFYRQDGSDTENMPYAYVGPYASPIAKAMIPLKTGSEINMNDASNSFTDGKYPIPAVNFILDGETDLEIGFQCMNNTMWVSWDNVQLSYSLIVPTSIALSQLEHTAAIGENFQLNVSALPEESFLIVTWTSSDPTVATVDENGLVTAVAAGAATITATTNDGTSLEASCAVTVVVPAASIALNKTETTIAVEAQEQLTVTVLPEGATDKTVTWTSSDPTVATVDENGLVTAVAAGAATITATTNDGTNLTATCEVTVETPISNYLTLTDVSGLIGARCVLPISMSNTESIKGLQFDLRLPDGVTVATNEYDEMMFTLTSRAHSSHTVSANRLGNGDYRVVVSSLSAKTFSGTEGVIMNVTLSVDNNQVAGDYEVKLFSIVLNTADNVSIKPNGVTATLSLSDVAPGDVNGDGSINVTDVGMVIDHILEHTPAGFIAEAADINGDGDINVTDVGLIIDIILSDNSAREVLMTENVKKSVEEIHEPQ